VERAGPTAGTETADPLEVLARVLVHMPDTGQVTTRYSGWYANRLRGMRGKAAPADGRKQQLFEVAPLACPACQGAMRIVACITQTSVIDQIFAHLRAGLAPALRRPCAAGPRRRAEPTPTRGRSGGAALPPARQIGPRRVRPPACDRSPRGAHGARARAKARRCPRRGAGEVGDRAGRWTESRPTPN